MTMTEQNLGNYIRLVKQCNDLQQELLLKNRIIALMVEDYDNNLLLSMGKHNVIKMFKETAISQLVAEQNKKAASVESI